MIRIGTAGWKYRDWGGIVYPKPKPRGFDELSYIAKFFNTVEINSSFYGPPRRQVAKTWIDRIASPQSSMKEVVYEVDGTAKYANLTLRNKDGGTEQNQVKLPFELKFYAKSGQLLYLSAQKVRATKRVLHASHDEQEVVYDGVAGNVHVLIRVSGAVLQEASSDTPHGIATAEGKLPD